MAEMGMSDDVAALAAALAKAQAEMGRAVKDAKNPHFKSTYADLASVQDAARAIHAHGLSYVQLPVTCGDLVGVRTVLMHESGQYIWSELVLPLGRGGGAQGAGSALTYARRYSLASVLGIAQEDDDGQAAQRQHHETQQRETAEQRDLRELRALMRKHKLDAVWLSTALDRSVDADSPPSPDEVRDLLKDLRSWDDKEAA